MQNSTIKGQLLVQKTNNDKLTLPKTGNFSFFLSSEKVKQKINEVIGGKDGQSFITNICSAVANNTELSKCENWSIVLSALQGGALKLSPQLGQFYLVPFKEKVGQETTLKAQFQIGFKGYIQLAIRSGQYKNLNVVALKDGELINYNPLTEELQTKFIEDDEIREKTPTIGYYAMFELINGFKKSIYWSKKKMVEHAKKYSQAYRSDLSKGYSYSFWSKNFDEMAFKTLLRQLISKWGVMSIEMQDAYLKDQTITNENGKVDYIDNIEDNNINNNINDNNNDNDIINITPEKQIIEEKQEELEEFDI